MKTTFSIIAAFAFFACGLQAQVTPTGRSGFAPLPLLQGRPGRVVTLSANLYEQTWDVTARQTGWRPLPGVTVGFSVDPLTSRGGLLPVGNLVTTDNNGLARARYRIPRNHPHPKTIRYKAYFAGDLSHHDTQGYGALRVK